MKEINRKQFESLCAIQCTEEEICAVLDVTDKTLTKWCKREYKMSFSEIFKIKREGGKASLRKSQWQLAQTNPTMAIWLGKQYLQQSDKREEKIEIGSDGFIEALRGTASELNEMGDFIES